MESITYSPLFNISDCKYTSCYCEENTYLLCKKFLEGFSNDISIGNKTYQSKAYCTFVTNAEKKTEIRFQKAGKHDIYKTVIWDYHVFFIHLLLNKEDSEDIQSKIYDLDTVLSFPESFENYFEKSFDFKKEYELTFRVIEASLFIENFATDRSHMVTGVRKEGKKFVKNYSAPPPDYPNIINSKVKSLFSKQENKETMNLEKYWDTKNIDPKFGKILKQSEFFDMFSSKKL